VQTDVLHNVSFSIDEGEMMAIVGTSGSSLSGLSGGSAPGRVQRRQQCQRHRHQGDNDDLQLGALLASQLNNLMPIIGAFLDGAALPVAIEPLQVDDRH
jgi:ABC-type phosphonate transport system ATPase subunit